MAYIHYMGRRAFLRAVFAAPAFAWTQGLGDFGAGPPPCNPNEKPTPAAPEGGDFKPGSPARSSLIEPGISGTKLVLSGYVSGVVCGLIKGARVDFWQADQRGVYDKTGFRLRGHQATDANGAYRLETIVPGPSGTHPPVIHVKVTPPGKAPFTTALFFADRAENKNDPAFRPELALKLTGPATAKTARFNIVLNL